MSEFRKNAEKLSQELARIEELTAKQDTLKLKVKQITGNANDEIKIGNGDNTFPFCRSSKPCEDKLIKTTRRNRYRVCTMTGTCNQQTHERNLAIAQAVDSPNGVTWYK